MRQSRASHCTQLDLAEQLQRIWQLNSTGDGPIVNGFQQQEMPALRTCPTRDLLLRARLTVFQPQVSAAFFTGLHTVQKQCVGSGMGSWAVAFRRSPTVGNLYPRFRGR